MPVVKQELPRSFFTCKNLLQPVARFSERCLFLPFLAIVDQQSAG